VRTNAYTFDPRPPARNKPNSKTNVATPPARRVEDAASAPKARPLVRKGAPTAGGRLLGMGAVMRRSCFQNFRQMDVNGQMPITDGSEQKIFLKFF
jgi:hypothetical protein